MPRLRAPAEVQPLLGLAAERDEHGARDQRALLERQLLALPHVAEEVGSSSGAVISGGSRRAGGAPASSLAASARPSANASSSVIAVVVGHRVDPPSGIRRTGSVLQPEQPVVRHPGDRTGGLERRRTRSASSSSVTWISSRARLAPRQKWAPQPKPRCGFGVRPTSKRNGSANDPLVAVGRHLPERDLVAGGDRRRRRARRRGSPCAACRPTASSSARSPRSPSGPASGRRAAGRSSSGWSAKASTAPASALRVVSAPAGNSRAKKAISSSSVRPDAVVVAGVDDRRHDRRRRGAARLSAIRSTA